MTDWEDCIIHVRPQIDNLAGTPVPDQFSSLDAHFTEYNSLEHNRLLQAERARAKKEEAAAAVEEMEEDEPAGTHTNPVPLHAQAAAAAAAAAGSSSEPTPPSTLTPSAGGPAAIAEAVPTHTSEAARNPDQPISANEQQEVGGLEIRQRPAPAGEAAGGDPLDGSEVGGLQIRQRPTATAAADAGAPSVGAAGRGSSGMGAAKSVKTTPGGLPGVSYAPSQQSSQQPLSAAADTGADQSRQAAPGQWGLPSNIHCWHVDCRRSGKSLLPSCPHHELCFFYCFCSLFPDVFLVYECVSSQSLSFSCLF